MAKGSIGYNGKSGLSKSTGMYGLEKGLGDIKGYGAQGKGSGMVYMVIGIGYAGKPDELAQVLKQYLPMLSQYLNNQSESYGGSLQKHDAMSLKGFFKPYNGDMSICEICGSPTPEGIRRCPTCSSATGSI